MYSKSLNPSLWDISPDVAQLGTRLDYSKGCWFEPTVRLYFSSSNVRLLAYVFTVEDQ